jgi:hypothetical protein
MIITAENLLRRLVEWPEIESVELYLRVKAKVVVVGLPKGEKTRLHLLQNFLKYV